MAQLLHVPLSDIQRDPNQPRKEFNEAALKDLASSIKARGVMQAITIRHSPVGDNGPQYMIIAGERRWRASAIAGEETIPCILKQGDEALDETIKAQQLTENLFREDLNPVEKAEFIQRRIEELKEAGITDALSQVAEELGVSASWISKSTAILKVAEDLRSLARVGKIRDYSIVKKLDKLSGARRAVAVTQIEEGTFIAKDFFKRKRYEKPAAIARSEGEGSEVRTEASPPTKEKTKRKTFAFGSAELVVLMKRTDFVFVLDNSDPDWENNHDQLPVYYENFRKWLAMTEDEMDAVSEEEQEKSPA